MSFRSFVGRKIRDPIHQQLTQGLSPEKIAATVAVGLCIAVNPIVGTTTILCLAAAWALRLNQPIMQAVNWSSYALQLLLIFPFIRLGEWMFRAPRETRSLERLVAVMKADPYRAFVDLRATLAHAFVAWLAVAPVLVAALYLATLPACRALARRVAAARLKGAPDVA
ncbi:MAG TPA: DUF2062 domain-containing protein [Thermoanaerobaculia bacterium]|jgi:uncharacterized protein (DUF2062 family)|nr:DUF2062 domain-containing protein [Thermoanaerobaculia bacterium]